MKPWLLLDAATIPGGGTLNLYQRDRDFSIKVGSDELMNSRAHGSEESLASMAWQRLGARPRTRALIGGLGMGFTLAATVRELGLDAQITVAELVPAVVRWNRGPLAPLAGAPLDDRRVNVHIGDVAELLQKQVQNYDLILLDVDNGPSEMSARGNTWLYSNAGLSKARSALRPGGVLGVWSAGADDDFTGRLRRTGFDVDAVPVRARGKRGAHHLIWLATRIDD